MAAFQPTAELAERRRTDTCDRLVISPSLTLQEAHASSRVLKPLADATRLRLLDLLASQTGPICVCDITPLFDQLQPTISHHLRLLRQARLIETQKRGLWSYYWATDTGRQALNTIRQLTQSIASTTSSEVLTRHGN